eukprot:TRINITY_DN14378_c0_g1_i2.p1 TRINITY_DN14378_c0_g1~~TRINITY_DN14378_c0_g1_i2.p1  ORF type:complete len:279 (+),score=8.01 TRINITY_DN14378_c0_g1_i2:306-1142(+)
MEQNFGEIVENLQIMKQQMNVSTEVEDIKFKQAYNNVQDKVQEVRELCHELVSLATKTEEGIRQLLTSSINLDSVTIILEDTISQHNPTNKTFEIQLQQPLNLRNLKLINNSSKYRTWSLTGRQNVTIEDSMIIGINFMIDASNKLYVPSQQTTNLNQVVLKNVNFVNSSITLNNVKVQLSKVNVYNSQQNGISLTRCQDTQMEEVTICQCKQNGIHANNSTFLLKNCTIYGCQYRGIYLCDQSDGTHNKRDMFKDLPPAKRVFKHNDQCKWNFKEDI